MDGVLPRPAPLARKFFGSPDPALRDDPITRFLLDPTLRKESEGWQERKLMHGDGEAERFYGQLSGPARVGLESTGNCHWFLDLLAELGHEVWIGDAARIAAKQVRQQRTDRRDAAQILDLLMKDDFPRIWTPSPQERDHRQLLIHRYKLVTLRARVKNELQHLAMNQGMQKGRSLWSREGQKRLQELPLAFWADTRRKNSRSCSREKNGHPSSVETRGQFLLEVPVPRFPEILTVANQGFKAGTRVRQGLPGRTTYAKPASFPLQCPSSRKSCDYLAWGDTPQWRELSPPHGFDLRLE